MPPLVIPDCVQAVIKWEFNTTPWAVNVLHYTDSTFPTINQAVADAFAADVGAAWDASGIGPLTADEWRINGVSVRSIDVANQPPIDAALVRTGTATGDALSPQLAVCITLRTALAGRSFRGRVFVPGGAEGDNAADGSITGAYGTACRNFVNALTDFTSGTDTFGLVVASRTLADKNLVTAVVQRDSVWDIQRRRKDGIQAF
jgi:hypothetical protein